MAAQKTTFENFMSLVSVGELENTEVSSSDYPFKSVCLPFSWLNCALFPCLVLITTALTISSKRQRGPTSVMGPGTPESTALQMNVEGIIIRSLQWRWWQKKLMTQILTIIILLPREDTGSNTVIGRQARD